MPSHRRCAGERVETKISPIVRMPDDRKSSGDVIQEIGGVRPHQAGAVERSHYSVEQDLQCIEGLFGKWERANQRRVKLEPYT